MTSGPKLPAAAWRALPAGFQLSQIEEHVGVVVIRAKLSACQPAMTIGGEVEQARKLIGMAHRSEWPASELLEAAARLVRAASLICRDRKADPVPGEAP